MLVRKIVGVAAYCFLSFSGSVPALAGDCVDTTVAVKMAQDNGLRPMILRGREMAPFVKLANEVGSTGLEHATFIAVVKTDSGAAVFFGNVASVCGPLMIDHATYNLLMRPVSSDMAHGHSASGALSAFRFSRALRSAPRSSVSGC